MENNILLDVKGLKTYFHTFKGVVKAVDDVSFSLKEGEILGIVGESGSGKSVTSFSILKLVEEPGVVEAEQILFDGRDLSRASERDMIKIRGKDISMVFQDPMSSLNPVYKVGDQVAEGLLQLVQLRLHLVVLRPGQLAALRVGEQVCKPRQLPLGPLVMMEGLHQRGQLLLLPVQGRHQVRVLIGLRLGQLGLQLLQPKGGLVQLFPHYDPCSRASCSAFFWACSSASRR